MFIWFECHFPLLPACLFAAVALAVLTFLALRPGKGWLRRKRAAMPIKEDDSNCQKSSPTNSMAGGSSGAFHGLPGSPPGALLDTATVGLPLPPAAAAISAEGLDTLLPNSRRLQNGGMAALDTFLDVAVEPAPTAPAAPLIHSRAPPSYPAPLAPPSYPGTSPQPLPPSYISTAGLVVPAPTSSLTASSSG